MSTQHTKATQATNVPPGAALPRSEKHQLTDSRKQFAISDELWAELKISNIRRGYTMPEALQEAVESYLKKHTKAS